MASLPSDMLSLAEHAGVELVAWPSDDELRQRLARSGVPRLLLVEHDAAAPTSIGLDEDWVRLPADERDIAARIERVARVVERLDHDLPTIDEDHVLHRAGTRVTLSPSQAAVASLLLGRAGTVVTRDALEHAVWADGAPGPKALDGVVFRLRRRLAGMGLVIRSAHARGFVLHLDVHPSSRLTG